MYEKNSLSCREVSHTGVDAQNSAKTRQHWIARSTNSMERQGRSEDISLGGEGEFLRMLILKCQFANTYTKNFKTPIYQLRSLSVPTLAILTLTKSRICQLTFTTGGMVTLPPYLRSCGKKQSPWVCNSSYTLTPHLT